jgi:putative solute:sodium symporter small subunit
MESQKRPAHWDASKRLVLILMLVWGIVSLGCSILFVEELNEFKIGHLPVGFWFAQQGSIVIFVALIFIFARAMDRLDSKHK